MLPLEARRALGAAQVENLHCRHETVLFVVADRSETRNPHKSQPSDLND
jgi:hypothetical protein